MKTIALLFVLLACSTAKHELKEKDTIEYRFEGTFSESVVFITKKIVTRHEDNLWMAVRRRGRGIVDTEWREYFKDTTDNRRLHNIDKLVQIVNHVERELPATREELNRLYQGTLLIPFGKVYNVSVKHVTVKVCGHRYKALHETGTQRIGDKTFYYDEVSSEDFPWYHISTKYWRGQEIYFQAEIWKCK